MTTDSFRSRPMLYAIFAMLPGCHPAISLGGENTAHAGTSSTSDVETSTVRSNSSAGGAVSTSNSLVFATGGTRLALSGRSSNAGGSTGALDVSSLANGGATARDVASVIGGNSSTASAANTASASGGKSSFGGSSATNTATSIAASAGSLGADCLQLNETQCRLDQRCTAVPGPHAREAECAGDARGFSNCITGGCRDLGTRCNSLEDLDQACSAPCSSGQWAVQPDSGCPSCVCVDAIPITEGGKGWDIASWLESDGWHFSLVPGTNRIKTCEEIKIHTNSTYSYALPNLVAVKSALTRIAAGGTGQFVSLCGSCGDIGCALDPLPTETVDDLKRFANAVGLTLNGL